MAQTAEQKVLDAIRKAFCKEGSNEPTLALLVQQAFAKAWANLGDVTDGYSYSPAEVREALLGLTRPHEGNPPVIVTVGPNALLQWGSTVREVAVSPR